MTTSLCDLFEPGAPGNAALEHALADIVARARQAWPEVELAPARFLPFLAARVTPETPLDRLPTGDLYLACACADGNPAALARFDAVYLREVDIAAAKARAAPGIRDEARQVVRDLLLVARGDRPAAIASYLGRGDLRGWIRVTAVREVLRLCKSGPREVAVEDDALLDALSPASDPALELVKQQSRAEFERAFRAAVAALDVRDRRLLRHQILDGLGVDEIAALFKVHRTTASRWLSAARDQLLAGTRTRLAQQLAISPREVDSLIRLIQSRLDVSLETVLK
ncbi:MAG TPA: sigma factor-like helix-turn-helix DNA-binding protein [Kofleriaceae bacterium]|nr:sigma factor-like helix-turn-helix DNA-binding protein [Kofleriaceae bacterium]